MVREAERPWVDCLWEKHEYFDYTPRWEIVELERLPVETLLAGLDREQLQALVWFRQRLLRGPGAGLDRSPPDR